MSLPWLRWGFRTEQNQESLEQGKGVKAAGPATASPPSIVQDTERPNGGHKASLPREDSNHESSSAPRPEPGTQPDTSIALSNAFPSKSDSYVPTTAAVKDGQPNPKRLSWRARSRKSGHESSPRALVARDSAAEIPLHASPDDASKLSLWSDFSKAHTQAMYSRITARGFRKTAKQKRDVLKTQTTLLTHSLRTILNGEDRHTFSVLLEQIASVHEAVAEVDIAEAEVDDFENQLIQDEDILQSNAPIVLDSSPAAYKLLQRSGYDFPPKRSEYQSSEAATDTRIDLEPEVEEPFQAQLARINSLEARILELQPGHSISDDGIFIPALAPSTTWTDAIVPLNQTQEEYLNLMRELHEARQRLESLRPMLQVSPSIQPEEFLPLRTTVYTGRMSEEPPPTDLASVGEHSSDNLEELSLEDLLKEPIIPFPDLYEDTEDEAKTELVNSWLFDDQPNEHRLAIPSTTDIGSVQSARSEPLLGSRVHSVVALHPIAQDRPSDSPQRATDTVQSLPKNEKASTADLPKSNHTYNLRPP